MRNSILMSVLLVFGMMLVQVVQVSAQETAVIPAKVATTSNPVITVSATVNEPGKLCLAMWTLSKLKEPYKITANSFLAYDVQVAKESIGQRGGIDFDGGDASSMRDIPAICDQEKEPVRGGQKEMQAAGTWYTRKFDLNPVVGKTFQSVKFLSAEINEPAAGKYMAKVRNIRIEDGAGKLILSLMPTAVADLAAEIRCLNMANGTIALIDDNP